MNFTVQVKRTQRAELHIEAKDWLEAKLLARIMDDEEAFGEAVYEFSEPFRIFEPVDITPAELSNSHEYGRPNDSQ